MEKLPDILLQELLTFASGLATEAGKVTLQYFRKDIDVEFKKDKSPVTVADRETEAFIRKKIQGRYPDHGIIGEEYGSEKSSEKIQWTIDPIDGTKSFIHGIPLYTVLLAVLYNGEPCLGVIHNPPLEETVAAATGMGCTYNGSPCRVSNTAELAEAYVQVTDHADLARRFPEFTANLLQKCGYTRTWADAYGYLMVASGRTDVMIDATMNLWDIAPLKPIITEAGGKFTDLRGSDTATGDNCFASNGILHDQVLQCFSK